LEETPVSIPAEQSTPDTPQNPPEPAKISLRVDGQEREFTYEQAYVIGCSLLEKGKPAEAAQIFGRLEEFPDRGPRAFIMGAFCSAATHEYATCSSQLTQAFEGDDLTLASALHDAFISINVGIRKEGIESLAKLVDEHKNLPTLSLLLGDLLAKSENLPLAKRCWSLAVKRDRPGGAVALAAARQLKKFGEESAADRPAG
jgi:hypothetical protein